MNDAVRIRFNPPVPGNVLYKIAKEAAQESGYLVSEEVIDDHSSNLQRMVYTIDQGREDVGKAVEKLFKLTLEFRERVPGGISGLSTHPKSELYLEINPDLTYDIVRCNFSPLDHNDALTDGADSIKEGRATPLDTFVMALHQKYREKSTEKE